MPRTINRLADRLLGLALPQAKASAACRPPWCVGKRYCYSSGSACVPICQYIRGKCGY